jgi:hypothetical protein
MPKMYSKIISILTLAILLMQGIAYAESDAGMVKEVKGNISIERGALRLVAKPGIKVQVSDRVITGEESSVGITLRDGTLLSAGSNSILILNKFAFDSTTHSGVLDASLKHGTLAVVSGKISKTSPEQVQYRTPTAILGVRGTEFVLEASALEN